jgi:AbrB family looped-hinge helix DNA binding protein
MGKFLTMSSKGQITLPKEMREELGLKAGDELVFSIIGRDILITPKSVDFNDLAGYLGDPPNGPATLDEIDETVAVAGGKAAAQPVRRTAKSHAA